MTEWQEFTNHVSNKLRLQTNKKFIKWMLTKENLGNHFFDSNLWWRSFNVMRELEKDNDHLSLICGLEGTGKSTLACQYAALVSPSFGAEYICYEQDDFYSIIDVAKPGDSIILDEGALFLFSREASRNGNIQTIKLLSICRQRNLHLIICIPSFWAVDSYVRQHRASTLLLVRQRGKYVGYNRVGIKVINAVGSGKKSILKIRCPDGTAWAGHFNKQFPTINDLNYESYVKLKAAHMVEFLKDLRANAGSEYIPISKFQMKFPLDRKTIIGLIERGELVGRKMGKKWFVHRLGKVENPQ